MTLALTREWALARNMYYSLNLSEDARCGWILDHGKCFIHENYKTSRLYIVPGLWLVCTVIQSVYRTSQKRVYSNVRPCVAAFENPAEMAGL